MPYKRKRRCKAQSGKQKKLITSRLMEISLKIDDYIYKNKTISEHDAENYIQEVVSYKPLCGNDERCLQVIEKLTRIMKGIIAEHRDLTVNICNDNFENGDEIDGSISPVYSTPDEDRTQCSYVISEDNINHTMSKIDKEIVDLCDSDDENEQEVITQENPSMVVDVEIHREMSNLSIIPTNEAENDMTSVDKEISQCILNNLKNIEINEEEQVLSPNGECSQSILKHFEINAQELTIYAENISCKEITTSVNNNHVMNVNKTANPVVHAPQHTKDTTVTTGTIPKICNNPILTIYPIQSTINNVPIDNTGIKATSTNKSITPSYTQNITNIGTNPSTIGKKIDNRYHSTNTHDGETHNKNAIANVTDNLQSAFLALNENGSRNDYCSKGNYNTKQQDNKLTKLNADVISNGNKQKKKKNSVNTNKKYKPNDARVDAASSVQSTDITDNKTKPGVKSTTVKKRSRKKKSEATSEKKDNHKFKKPPAMKTATNKVKQPKKIMQIYNNNTDNDLSWVENIRFVREINENEYDRQLKFEDDFWDNCSFPGICDERDFNY